ncbi:MAG: nucleotide exchange factor GrpE [bacterium]
MSHENMDSFDEEEEETQPGEKNIEEPSVQSAETAGAETEGPVGEQGALQLAEQKAKENYDKFLRVYAEFENYKKRMDKEKSEFIKYANEGMIKDLLVVLDNLERAAEQARNDEQAKGIALGVEMVLKLFKDILEKHGLREMKAMGEHFDPRLHDAVIHEVVDDREENMVIEEFQKGYVLKDRLIRPAMVKVSKRSNKNAESGMNGEE